MCFFSEQLQGTEFGLYYLRYNSRLPIISARTGTAAGVGLALQSANAVATGGATIAALTASGSPDPVGQAQQIGGAIGTDRYAQTASYFIEYPEDIDLFGASFNTELGNSGWALQGEYSFKKDLPLQIDDVELLFAALTPLAALNPSFTDNQVGVFAPDTVIPGFIERDVSQIQATATKIFGPTLGANTGIFLFELGVNHVHDMPSQDTLRLNGSATDTSGNARQSQAINPATGAPGAHAGKAAEPSSAFPTPWSWGYRMAAQLTYDNVFAAINLSPRVQWAHDVQGISPQPAGPFREGRKAVSVGLKATYLQQWELDLAYTDFFGAGKYNLLNDRDFFTATLKFSF
jgi:hypothetical protein